MSLKLIGESNSTQLFADSETGRDYAVVLCNHTCWEYLYIIVDIVNNLFVYNVDGATAKNALESYLKYGYEAVADLGVLDYDNDVIIDTIRRPGCDRQYKVRGSNVVYEVVKTQLTHTWAIFESSSDTPVFIEAFSKEHALTRYLSQKGELSDV